jgi:hypothetical protein
MDHDDDYDGNVEETVVVGVAWWEICQNRRELTDGRGSPALLRTLNSLAILIQAQFGQASICIPSGLGSPDHRACRQMYDPNKRPIHATPGRLCSND